MCWAFGVEGVQNLTRFTYRDPRVNSQLASSAQGIYLLSSFLCVDGWNNTIMIARLEKQLERSEFPYFPLCVVLYYVQ